MRTGAMIVLFLSFVFGMASAFALRFTVLDVQPAEIVEKGPTQKILVAVKEIPQYAEITAESVSFTDVPVDELPSGALLNYKDVYQQRAALPIPAGYPVCSDFLLVEKEDSGGKSFLPPGSKIVSVEVGQLRVGASVLPLSTPIADYLKAKERIDIFSVFEKETAGVYVERKNELLRAYLPQREEIGNEGEPVLQGVEIFHILSKKHHSSAAVRQIQALTLLLDEGEAAKLKEAAKKGKLRVVRREAVLSQQEEKVSQLEQPKLAPEEPLVPSPEIIAKVIDVIEKVIDNVPSEPAQVFTKRIPVIDFTQEELPAVAEVNLDIPQKIEKLSSVSRDHWQMPKLLEKTEKAEKIANKIEHPAVEETPVNTEVKNVGFKEIEPVPHTNGYSPFHRTSEE